MGIYRDNDQENVSNNVTISNVGGLVRKSKQSFFKENYIKAVEIITPKQYLSYNEQDSEGEIRPTEQLINLLLDVVADIDSVLPISSVNDNILSGIGTVSGFSRFLVKQNNFTFITPNTFNEKILVPVGRSFADFKNKEEFYNYLTSGLLSSITCIEGSVGDITLPSAFGNANVDRHQYLAKYLSLVYFLNRKGQYSGNIPSDFIKKLASVVSERLTNNQPVVLSDCAKLLIEYLYLNHNGYFVDGLASSVSSDDISRLDTLCDIVFSPLYIDAADTKVKESFKNLIISPTFRYSKKESDNPFARLLEAVSFSLADINNQATELETLTNIDLCPNQFLPYLADLIGWKLLGYDPNNWRLQLKNATEIQKSRGTKKSIQLMLDMLFGQGAIIHSDDIKELWESYVPHLMLYAIATDSSLFKDGFVSFTPQVAQDLGVAGYNTSSLEDNIRSCVDRILFELVLEEPDNFSYFGSGRFPRPEFHHPANPSAIWYGDWHFINGTYYTGKTHDFTSIELLLQNDPANVFKYRGKITSIPPFEEYGYYSFAGINSNLAYAIKFKLKCFGVSEGVADAVAQYLLDYSVNNFELSSMNQGFLVFTKNQTIPPNYNAIINNSIQQTKLDRLKYLSLWSGKSSHFSLVIDSALIDFTKKFYDASSIYGIREISNILKENVPAHAIPKISLHSSSTDFVEGTSDSTRVELLERTNEAFIGSAGLAHGYQLSSWYVNPSDINIASMDRVNDSIFSGAVGVYPRNLLRRRDKRNFLPRGGYLNRSGLDGSVRGVSGSASALYTSAAPILGYIATKGRFVPVPLTQSYGYPMTKVLDRANMHSVWSKCEDLSSSSVFNLSGVSVPTSSTYPARGLNINDVSAGYLLKTRDEIDPMLALEHKVGYYDKILQAYYILSSYWLDGTAHTTSSTFPVELNIVPNTVSSWFNLGDSYDTVRSLANYLDYLDASSTSMSKYDEFMFGRGFNQLFGKYNNFYSGTLSALNLDELDNNSKFKPTILSHIFGPYIYNGGLFEEGVNSSAISRKMDREEKDISYGLGVGVLSPYTANTVTITPANGSVGSTEYINSSIVDGIGLIDTSAATTLADEVTVKKVFSVFKIPLSGVDVHSGKVPLWARNDLFLDSMAIKYSRPYESSLPRIRVTINPAGAGNYRNFLLPNNEYKLKIRALSINKEGTEIGGNSLCAWIHTNPIGYPRQESSDKKVWSFFSGKWRSSGLSEFSGAAGISLVSNGTSIAKQFSSGDGPITQTIVSQSMAAERTCHSYIPEVITEVSATVLPEITNDMFEVVEYDFNTIDNTGDGSYTNNTPINTSSTVYHIDLLLKNSNPDRMVIIDSIWIENVTLQRLATIKTTYGNYNLNKVETKTCLEYFNDLSKGGLSRSPFYSSGVMMNPNGGSRASYRTSFGLYNSAATDVHINTGQTLEYNIVE